MILIVDDDIAIRTSLRLMLGCSGHEVTEAADAAEAMAAVRAKDKEPELILLDMNFSRFTTGDEGLTLLRQIKVFRPHVPVILMTAWGNVPLAVEGMKAGAADFFTKPWDNGQLMRRIEELLRENGRREKPEQLDTVERRQIKQVLESVGGNISRAAEILGISRAALYRRLDKHGL